MGNGDGTFQSAVTYDPGGSATSSIAIADLNGDGKPDLVVANADSGNIGVLLGNGNGTFQPVTIYGSGGELASSVAIADVNGDGRPDLVVASPYGNGNGKGTVGVLLGNGDGTFQPAVTYDSGGSSASSVAIADVNSDGRLDLVVTNTYGNGKDKGGSVGVLLGNGNGTFQAARDVNLIGWSSSALVADLTGDGRPELLVTMISTKNYNVGQLAMLPNNTAPNATKTVVTTSGSPSFINQPVTLTATITSSQFVPDGEPVIFTEYRYYSTDEIGKGFTAHGVATLTTSSLSVGTHSIKTMYLGDRTYRPSFANVKQVVDRYPTTTALTSSPNPSAYGQAVTFTVTVTSAGPMPTGRVLFKDGKASFGRVYLSNGVATLTTSKLAEGTHPITADYPGNDDNVRSTSPVLDQVVQ